MLCCRVEPNVRVRVRVGVRLRVVLLKSINGESDNETRD